MNTKAFPGLALIALWIAGCSGPTEPQSTPESPAMVSIRGEAVYRERIAPPAGARLEISLVNTRLADTPDAVVARHVVENVGSPPIPFELAVDPSKLDGRMSYSIAAVLRDVDDKAWFVTDTQNPVVPGQAEPLTLNLIRVGQSPAASVAQVDATASAQAKVRYRCGDRIVDAEFADDQAILRYDDEERALPIAMSGSGARYAQDGIEFWSKGNEATLRIGEERSDCAPSDEITPWEAAQARGVRFRAIGNEPGWLVELDAGESPAMTLTLDNGERELAFERTTPIDGANGYRGEHDGTSAELRLTETDCEDPMSGERFPVRAQLRVGDREYTGCGRHLAELK
jgi:uncharacterized lipoprotein YbaY/uncharacterized membrane protein